MSAEINDFVPKSFPSEHQDGLYIVSYVNGIRMNCLIDTGASLTVIHPSKYLSIPEQGRPPLQKIDRHLRMADGGQIPAIGKTILTLDFGRGVKVDQTVVVADVEAPLVLGYDFQFLNKCLVDVGQCCIYINGQRFSCLLESRMNSIFKISISETVTIPPRTEVLLSGNIRDWKAESEELIMEPNDRFQSCTDVMISATLVKVGDLIPLRLINFSNVAKGYRSAILSIG